MGEVLGLELAVWLERREVLRLGRRARPTFCEKEREGMLRKDS